MFPRCIYGTPSVYTAIVTKHLVDIDDEALGAAQATLGTRTIKETVNKALRVAVGERSGVVKESFDRLGRARLADRETAWR